MLTKYVVLKFYGLISSMGSCGMLSVSLTTHLLDRLSPLSGYLPVCILSRKLTALVSAKEHTKYIGVSVRCAYLHITNLMGVAIALMCASASPVLHSSHIPYTLCLLQRDPDQIEHTAESVQRLS